MRGGPAGHPVRGDDIAILWSAPRSQTNVPLPLSLNLPSHSLAMGKSGRKGYNADETKEGLQMKIKLQAFKNDVSSEINSTKFPYILGLLKANIECQ